MIISFLYVDPAVFPNESTTFVLRYAKDRDIIGLFVLPASLSPAGRFPAAEWSLL